MISRLGHLERLLILGLSAVSLRLVHLQVLRGAHYRALAEQNRLRVVPEQGPRGLIVDRNGVVLASNQTIFRVAVVPQELRDPERVFAKVSAVTHRPIPELQRRLAKERGLAFLPAAIVTRVPKDVALQLEEERWRFAGLLVKPETVRRYPRDGSAAALLGHLSQPTAEELPQLKPYGVRPRSLVGRMGLERLFDHELRGRPGGVVVEVNHRGRQVRVVGERETQPGSKLTLTIDANLQALIEEAFGEQPGAAVVLSPDTGEVLAMVSSPTFLPEVFAVQDSSAVQDVLSDARSLLLNRATGGVYTPGSIIKLVTAAAALEAKLITPETTIVCPGSITIGDRTFRCWNRDGHGAVNLATALMRSCNVYFMTVGRRLGATRLKSALSSLGGGRTTGWPLEERTGRLPTRRLSEGEVAMLAIGQGELLLTPLQAAVMAGAFASGGWIVRPWIIRGVAEREGGPGARRRLGWSPGTMEAIRQGMRWVVESPEGTGHRAFSPAVKIAGKTGTAQTHLPQAHGWFVGYCPEEAPRAALAVVAEHGGSGGDLPTAIARAICEYIGLPETR